MLLAGVVVLARGSAFMLGPELELRGERLTQYCRLESLPGPQDRWRAAEGRSATLGQTLSLKSSEKVLEDQTMLDVWFGGVQLMWPRIPLPWFCQVIRQRMWATRRPVRIWAGWPPPGKFIGTAKARTRRISVFALLV